MNIANLNIFWSFWNSFFPSSLWAKLLRNVYFPETSIQTIKLYYVVCVGCGQAASTAEGKGIIVGSIH